jgi:hypothetical protein
MHLYTLWLFFIQLNIEVHACDWELVMWNFVLGVLRTFVLEYSIGITRLTLLEYLEYLLCTYIFNLGTTQQNRLVCFAGSAL